MLHKNTFFVLISVLPCCLIKIYVKFVVPSALHRELRDLCERTEMQRSTIIDDANKKRRLRNNGQDEQLSLAIRGLDGQRVCGTKTQTFVSDYKIKCSETF